MSEYSDNSAFFDLLMFGQPTYYRSDAMMAANETIDHATLRQMHAAGVVTDAALVAEPDGWSCVVQVRQKHYPLVAKHGGIRHWARMESAVNYLAELGIRDFRVDARGYNPAAVRKHRARPDAAARLQQAHQARKHDEWFREQVQAEVEAADNPDAQWLEHADVESEFVERRQASRSRLGDDG